MGPIWCYSILVYYFISSTFLLPEVYSETILLLGGEVDSILHPATDTINTYGACGVFQSDLPPLSKPRREFSATLLGDDLVICGGMQLLSPPDKDCSAITLGTWPLEWRTFPSMIHGRDRHGLVTLGSKIYAVGGSRSIGSERSIEMWDGGSLGEWTEVGQTNGYRQDFCALAWGDDGILVTGGYDDVGQQTRVELYNVTAGTWRMLARMPEGKGLHACGYYQGGVVVAGGWTASEDGEDISQSVAWYDPQEDSWTMLEPMKRGRSSFALQTINGTLTAIGGWNGMYTESVEQMGQDGKWRYLDHGLGEAKASFGVVKLQDGLLDDPNCEV